MIKFSPLLHNHIVEAHGAARDISHFRNCQKLLCHIQKLEASEQHPKHPFEALAYHFLALTEVFSLVDVAEGMVLIKYSKSGRFHRLDKRTM